MVSVDHLVQRLRQPGFAARFLSDRGQGKIAYLIALRERFPDAPYCYFAEKDLDSSHSRCSPPLPQRDPAAAPFPPLAKLFRRPASFVIGTHVVGLFHCAKVKAKFGTQPVTKPGRGPKTAGRLAS